MSRLVRSVNVVEVTLQPSTPASVVIRVGGTVTTGGWANARLLPRAVAAVPADGMLEFDLVADPPDGMATMVISPVSARIADWPFVLPASKGVRVHAQNNALEATPGSPRRLPSE